MFISVSTPPAERTRKSQLSKETSDVSQVKQARTVASTRSWASRVGTRPGLSQARTDCASQATARGVSHGASTGTFLAIALDAGHRLPGTDQRERADARDVAAVAADLAARGEHVVALDERLERGHARLLGQGVEAVVVGADEAAAHVDGYAPGRGLGPDPAPHPVPGLEHDDRLPGLGQPPRRGQPGQAGTHHADVGFHRWSGHRCHLLSPKDANMRAARM